MGREGREEIRRKMGSREEGKEGDWEEGYEEWEGREGRRKEKGKI